MNFTKGQYNDLKETALRMFREEFKETIRLVIQEDDLFAETLYECVSDILNENNIIEGNFEKVLDKLNSEDIKEAIIDVIYNKLSQ